MQFVDTPETEAKYRRLEALGKKLGVPYCVDTGPANK
jgi:hypothetical protein